MKGRNVIGIYAKILIAIIVIIVLAFGITKYLKQEYKEEVFKTAKTDMLLVQAKIETISKKIEMKEKNVDYIGNPIIDMAEDKQVQSLIKKGVLNVKAKGSKLYVLENRHLESLNLSEINLEKGYYIVDYKTSEVIYTKGVINQNGEICYKLSEITK